MNPIIVDPGENFRSQLNRLFPTKQSKKARWASAGISCKESLRLREVQCITTKHTFNTVTNGSKPIKAHHFILRWLNGSKRASKCQPKSSPPPHEHPDTPYTLDRKLKWGFTQSVLEIEDQAPPDYPDHSDVFLKLGRREKDDNTSCKVRYAVECVDSILHSQSEHCGDAGPQDYLVHDVELAKPQLSALEYDFQHFYSSLTPFTLSLGSNRGSRIRDLIAADTWGDLFLETANVAGDATGNMPARSGTGVSSATGIAVSRRRDHDDHPAPTTPEGGGRSGAGPSKLSRPTSLLDPQLLAEVAGWEIDRLHEHNSIELTPCAVESTLRSEAVAAVSNFDVDFQSGGTSNVEWRRSRLGDTIPAERITLSTSESIGFRRHSDNGTVSGRSYNGRAAQTSQASASVNQKPLLKRGRDDGDRDEGKKRKKKDQRPQTPSGPFVKEVETFSCPFKGRDSPAVKHSCSTNFPNLSKVKEHLRRVHFQHLQCPHELCDFCAGSPFEIKRHQKQKQHSSKLVPIEQKINLNHLQKHKALKLKKLTWDTISQICFSMDFTQKLLDRSGDEEDDRGNLEGDASETDQDDEVPDIANESTLITDSGDEAIPNDDEFEESPEQQQDSAPTEARPHDYTSNKNLPEQILMTIRNGFQAMEQKCTLRIISHLEAYSSLSFDIYKEVTTVLEGFNKATDNYSKFLATPQTNVLGRLNSQQASPMPTSQLNYAESSHHNFLPVYPPLPTSPQTYQGPITDFNSPTPMNSKQENVASCDFDDRTNNELLLDLKPQPHLDLNSGWEFIEDHAWSR